MLETSVDSRFLVLCRLLSHSIYLSVVYARVYLFGVRSNSLSTVWRIRNVDMKTLELFAAGGKAHFQFKAIVALEILAGAIERDKSRRFDRQALFEIGRFEHRATHGDGAVFGRDGEPYRRQRTGSAIGVNAGVDADAHLAPSRRLDFAIK